MCFEHRIDKKTIETIKSIRSAIKEQEQIVSEFENQTTPDKDGWIQVCKSQVKQANYKLTTLKKSLNSLLNGKKSSVFGWCECYHCSTMSDAKYSELAKTVLGHISKSHNVGVSEEQRKAYIFSLFDVAYPQYSIEDKKCEYSKFMKPLNDMRFEKFWCPEHYHEDMIQIYLMCNICPHSQKCLCEDSYCNISIEYKYA